MANIVVLVPKQKMYEQVLNVVKETGISIQQIKVIETPNAVNEARLAIEQGANIIVARGAQATLIKQNTKIPIVEIRLTGQELGLLIKKAKQIAQKEDPHIALIGFANQFSNTDHFEELFGIHLHVYYMKTVDDTLAMVELAVRESADVIIGGDLAIQIAQNLGVPSLFMESSEESIREAFDMAQRIGYAANLERRSKAQLETILDTSFGGIIKIDSAHDITAINHFMERILDKKEASLLGVTIEKEIPGIEAGLVDDILDGKQKWVTSSVSIGSNQLMVTAAPIEYDGQTNGAIFSFLKLDNPPKVPSENLREMYLKGYLAHAGFQNIDRSCAKMKECIELAKEYTLTKKPVLIYGETGTEKEIFAQAIHNNSARRNQPFITVACVKDDPSLYQTLFGEFDSENESANKKGVLEAANYGSVYISDIENMPPKCQYQLARIIQQNALSQNEMERTLIFNTRILASASSNLAGLVKNGLFREDLYYILNSFSLEIPPLRETPQEIGRLAQKYVKDFSQQYYKFVVLTEAAYQKLSSYLWEGNLIQLKAFCERMVLTTTKRIVNEDFIDRLFSELYPLVRTKNGQEKITVFKHPQAVRIADLLEKYGGNRTLVARELGISTTTLWRHMKKYGVEKKYDV